MILSVKSLNNYPALLVLDLASYGSALAVINQFCDDDQVKVFEVSPVGTAAILILLIKDQVAADLLKNEIFSFYKPSILAICLLKDVDAEVLKVYLSQNKTDVLKNILVQEFSFVSEALRSALHLIRMNISLLDLRIIRTFPLNAVLVSSSNDITKLIQANVAINSRTSVIIDQVTPTLKDYFQVIQN